MCIEWPETRDHELFWVIAELESGTWRFFERSTWEVCWFEVPSSQQLLEKTRKLGQHT